MRRQLKPSPKKGKGTPMSDTHNAISNWTVFVAMAVLFYASAWHTKNPEYVTVANTALTMATVLFVTDFIILIWRNR